ncbi:MAG: hypothetical protein HYV16_15325 [Gammaproteobacteria bacterium]|nr:hypothetical protein [Gammaproteobacteria bacterium]
MPVTTSWRHSAIHAALALSLAGAATTTLAKAQEMDRPSARLQAMSEWYNEAANAKKGGKSLKASHNGSGGVWTTDFRRFMMEAAAKENAKWNKLMPTGEASRAGLSLEEAAAAATGTSWLNLGPTKADVIKNGGTTLNKTDAGRIRNIVIDPNNAQVIYAAFAGGGVWKTTDGGATWAPKTETLGSLSVGALAMDPSNSNTLYLGLGDPFDGTGIGLVKSTDGGNTWSSPVYLGDSTAITSVMVAPGATATVLATTDKGLYRSTDSGATWSAVSLATGQTAVPYGWSLAWTGGNGFVVSLEANKAATSGTTDGQIWYSNNNGASWTKASGVTKTGGLGRITVASAPSSRTTLYAMAAVPNATSDADLAEIFKSTNGGASWTALGAAGKRYTNRNNESANLSKLLNGQGWYDHAVLVDKSNPNTAYFGGALLLAKTTDGGTKFSQLTNWLAQYSLPYVHADFHTAAQDSLGNLYVGSDGGIFKSTNGGTSWSDSLNIGIASHLVYSVGSSPANTNAVIGGFQDNGTRVRSGSTSTFNQSIGGDGFGSAIHQTNANTMLGTLYYSRIYKSTDGGNSFVSACSGITECNNSGTAPFITGVTSWAGNADTVYTWSNAKVYKSTNFATSWTALGATGLPTTSLYLRGVGVAPSNSNIVGAVANGGRVFLTSNGGSSWAQTADLPNNGLSMSSVSFDALDPNTVYVTSVAADATKNHVWKSTNFGQTWTAIDGNGLPLGVPVNSLKADPNANQTLYAATHLGVYRSTDGGASWVRFGTGMPLVNVTDIYLSADSSLVRASTFGRGFWQLMP